MTEIPMESTSRFALSQRMEAMSAPGGVLHIDSRLSTIRLLSETQLARRSSSVIDEFLQGPSKVAHSRTARVVTGPPGSGKSTSISYMGRGWGPVRQIDPDLLKYPLLARSYRAGLLDELLEQGGDGDELRLLELSALVQHEANRIASRALGICLQRGEAVVLEGTFWSWSRALRFLHAIDQSSTRLVQVVACDASEQTVIERTQARWWRGHGTPCGARFTPASYIREMYPSTGRSRCSAVAARMANVSPSAQFTQIRVRSWVPAPTEVGLADHWSTTSDCAVPVDAER